MADEISLTITLAYSKGGVSRSFRLNDTFDVSGTAIGGGVQNIGTSWEVVSMGDVTAPGWIIVKNIGPTNYVEFSSNSGGTNPLLKLKVDEFEVFRLTGTTLYARANTAAVDLDITIFSD
jgi:hypothetical protein